MKYFLANIYLKKMGIICHPTVRLIRAYTWVDAKQKLEKFMETFDPGDGFTVEGAFVIEAIE